MTDTQFLEQTAHKLKIPLPKLMKDSLRAYLENQLWRERATMHEIMAKYGVTNAAEMKARYEKGELEEEGTWEDYFRLEHAGERVKNLEALLEET